MEHARVLGQTARQAPLERLRFFRDQLGLDEAARELLARLRPLFMARQEAFADYFYSYFIKIDKTAAILNHEARPAQLRRNWTSWYASLFQGAVDDEFLNAVWRSGVAHVRVRIDQRYINLGYGLARAFCQRVIQEGLPLEEQATAIAALSALLDLCILVATDAYVEATTVCDREVIDGIAHHIRNPVSIIGGNAHRLHRAIQDPPLAETLDVILDEARRLERLAANISVYMHLFQKETHLGAVPLADMVAEALARLPPETTAAGPTPELELALPPAPTLVVADREDVVLALTRLLEEARAGLPEDQPRRWRLWSEASPRLPGMVDLLLWRSGACPDQHTLAELFTPFVSWLPTGSGFDLPIARLAASKNLGRLALEPGGEEAGGMTMRLTLPVPAAATPV